MRLWPLQAFAIVCTLATPLAAQSGHLVPLAGFDAVVGATGGVAMQRVEPASDTLGTRPTVRTLEAAFAPGNRWRVAGSYDAWRPGNRRRLVANAFAEQMPVELHSSGFRLAPQRVGADITSFRQGGPSWWLYLGLSMRHSLGDAIPFSNPFCGDVIGVVCAADWEPATGPAALSYGYPIGGRAPEHTVLLAQVGRLSDTRDNIFAPQRGHYLDVGVQARAIGGRTRDERSYAGKIDYRQYFGTRSGAVWAFRGIVARDSETDCCGFDDLADVPTWSGASNLGAPVFAGWLLRAEWRGPTRWMRNRLGMAVLGEMRQSLAPDIQDVRPFEYGFGLRYRLDRDARTTLRLDVTEHRDPRGFRQHPWVIRLALGEAF